MNKLQHQGNLLEYIQGDCDIQILRVYGYESRPTDVVYQEQSDWAEDKSEEAVQALFSLVWKNIPFNWRDNKSVVEVNVGPWRLFLGYWDSYQTIGFGVKPNQYLPKGNFNKWGRYEPINISKKMKFKTLKATLIEGRKLAQIVVDYINDHYTDIDDAIRLLAAYNFDSWDRFQVQLDWEHGIETLTDESFDINNAGDYEVLMLIKQNLAKKTLERILPISSSIQVIPNAAHNKELHKKVKKYKPGITSYGGWYLHGQLENDVQYDLADFYTVPDELTRVVPHFTRIQNDQVTYTGKMIRVPYINGVYRVNVLGIDKPCVGIFWTPVYGEYEYNGMPWEHYRQSGLICYESDWEAIAHAACKEGEHYL